MMFHSLFRPSSAPPGFGSGKVLPESTAPLLSRLIFQWLGPFLEVGYSRPLEKEDLWELPQSRLTVTVTDDVESHFYLRCPPEKRPRYMRDSSQANAEMEGCNDKKKSEEGFSKEMLTVPSTHPSFHRDSRPPKSEEGLTPGMWFGRGKKAGQVKYDESLFKAIHGTFFTRIWMAGVLKLASDTLKTTTPLLTKVMLTWLTDSYIYARTTQAQRAVPGIPKPQGIGYGIGLAVALFAMQESASLMTNHYMQISMTTGLSIRTGIIGSIFRKSLRLSGRSRMNHSVGQITTMISTDAARLDRFSGFAHEIWASPIQLAIGFGLLLGTLGYSALVGLGVFILGFPVQILLVKVMFTQRKTGVQITDKRVRLTSEVLQGIRLIKLYAWEAFYTRQLGELRMREIKTIRKSALARSILIASMTFIPLLASILSFITYALSGHDLNIAIIFSSLQLFNIIRIPLLHYPLFLSSLSDTLVALGRISDFLTSEDLLGAYPIDHNASTAVQVDGDFVWETVYNPAATEKAGEPWKGNKGPGAPSAEEIGRRRGQGDGPGDKKNRSDRKGIKGRKSVKTEGDVLPTIATDLEKDRAHISEKNDRDERAQRPFELNNLRFAIPHGAFIAIIGRVGCGKSSLLQALIGEMRRTRGEVCFGGKVSYAPQVPWIRNATFRENVLFGQPDDEDRFREVIRACNLDDDLEILPHAENTEIGERGINLSGGQKARVSLARAAYYASDIVLLDDPLSAVDAHVGKSILDNCLLSGPLASRTRILVTHALHVLDKTDYIYVMDNGSITEQGTYEDLIANGVTFPHLIEEYGKLEAETDTNSPSSKRPVKKVAEADDSTEEGGPKKHGNKALMQTEERNTGAVTWTVYKKYLGFAGGMIWVPVIVLLLTLTQGAQVGSNLFLGFWTSQSIHGFKQGDYIAVYAGLGVAQAIFFLLLSFSFAIASLVASLDLFKAALKAVLRSPTSFFDTTPMGRILSRLSKDQDTLDTELASTLMQFLTALSSVLGTVALVFYSFPPLGIIFLPMSILYYIVSSYYRRSSVETKRLDSLMRSVLYGSFSETLTGLATIRAYREQARCVQDAESGLDLENRAYYMTISIQRWLAVRLDLLGNILIFGIALFAAGFRHKVNPAMVGVVLSYTLSITQTFSEIVSQFAQNEQNMNAVERVLHYTGLEPEGESSTPNDPPPPWPSKGEISFSNVKLAYRKGLPLVLKDISFDVKAGEKVGIVGRTGAGKSSLLQALFRIVELVGGKIEIDGRNIHDMGLDVLRSRLASVPQDGTLFLGTLRENLDPQGLLTDAELISILQRAWLLPRDGPPEPVVEAKFSLDSTVGDEGFNFSSGEKQLLALCRALVKNSKIIILDEATSNVDVETDAKLQRTIKTEFTSSTLLCIAHRLNTIAYYDRVLVMNEGKVAEFDTVLNLFDKTDSIFRSLCDEANLQRMDIVRIRNEHSVTLQSS